MFHEELWQGNNAIHKRHPTLFKDKKDHYYSFGPSDKLVQTIPFELVANLKDGAYTRLPSKWMSNIWSKLNQSQRNSITSIRLVRSLRPSDKLPGVLPLTIEPDEKSCYIYEVFMEKSNFFVGHGLISKIIGDELWMDSEINCLCNVASDWKIWLTLGSKRKSVDLTEINIGDWVTISNHGNLFPQAQVEETDFSKNLTKVKWETSCTTDVVEIVYMHPWSKSITSKQKRIETNFFHHHNSQRYQTTANDEKLVPQSLLQSKRESRQTSSIIIIAKGIRPQQMMKSEVTNKQCWKAWSLFDIIHLKIHQNSALKDLWKIFLICWD